MPNRATCAYQRYQARKNIRAFLLMEGLTITDFAKKIGLSIEIVSATISGKKHSPQVLDALKNLGVPDKLLCDPRTYPFG